MGGKSTPLEATVVVTCFGSRGSGGTRQALLYLRSTRSVFIDYRKGKPKTTKPKTYARSGQWETTKKALCVESSFSYMT